MGRLVPGKRCPSSISLVTRVPKVRPVLLSLSSRLFSYTACSAYAPVDGPVFLRCLEVSEDVTVGFTPQGLWTESEAVEMLPCIERSGTALEQVLCECSDRRVIQGSDSIRNRPSVLAVAF